MSTDAPSADADPQRRLKRGELVHVKPGSRHPIYADLPMGGWSGTIERMQKKGRLRRYWVRFSDAATLTSHEVSYRPAEKRGNESKSPANTAAASTASQSLSTVA